MHIHDAPAHSPFLLTIFGASGDLAKIKLFPALYTLYVEDKLPENFFIVGYARSEFTDEEFRATVAEAIEKNSDGKVRKRFLREFIKHVTYFSGQYDQDDSFVSYKDYIASIGVKADMPHLAYLSTPPSVFGHIVAGLSAGRRSESDDIRIIIEKPFGISATTAEKLFHTVSSHFNEEQFFLLDHYLGKSSVQSVLNMRQSNRILSNVMQGSEIANIQITAFEEVGVDHRIGYFEGMGIVRDMIQSHLLQVFALVAMQIPNKRTAESLQREKHAVISAINCPCDPDNLVLGQHESYRDAEGVAKDSNTETFAAVRMFLDKQAWAKVPIYIRTGKKLKEKHTYVVVELKKFAFQSDEEEPNRLIIEFSPEAKINITLINPDGRGNEAQQITTTEAITCSVNGCLPEHGDLLLDVIHGERMHYLSFAEIIASWKIIDQIIEAREAGHVEVEQYKDGTCGPESQKKLTEMDGFAWYDLH